MDAAEAYEFDDDRERIPLDAYLRVRRRCMSIAWRGRAEVFVLPEHRGRGVGVELVRTMIERGPGACFQWMLHTRDAHALYEKFGFGPRTDGRYIEQPAQLG